MSAYQDNSHTSSRIISAIDTFYNCRNKIVVTTNPGALVTATCNNTKLVSDSYSGVHHFYYDQFGQWIINVSCGQLQLTDYVNVEELKDYSKDMSVLIDTTLDNNSWQVIQYAARENIGSSYWPIGAMKKIILNGTVSSGSASMTFNNDSYYVYIISFHKDHDLYGNTGITFQCFRKETNIALYDIALTDSSYGSTSGSNLFIIDSSNTSTWSNCFMRNSVCGTDVNNPGTTFLSILPSDLKDVLLPVEKKNYNDIDHSSTDFYYTTEYLFLLDVSEIGFQYTSYGNCYDYYNGNTVLFDGRSVKYRSNILPQIGVAIWWTRTISLDNKWRYVYINGKSDLDSYHDATRYISYGFAPAFVVG